MNFSNFTIEKNPCLLHGQVFVMPFEVSSDRLEKPGIKPGTPGLQGECATVAYVEIFVHCFLLHYLLSTSKVKLGWSHHENTSVYYNEYPLEPHFYTAKLGYAGVYLFLPQNIDCGTR